MKYAQGGASLTTLARLGVRGERHVLAVTIEKRVWLEGRGMVCEQEVVFAENEPEFTRIMIRRYNKQPFRWRRVNQATYVRKSLPPPSKNVWKGSPP